MTEGSVSLDLGDDYSEIREAVTKICDEYPGEYWRGLEDQGPEGSYPTAFVKALTAAGFLGALIPEEYGGSGLPIRAGAVILETVHANGCSAAACHAQMYIMGTLCVMVARNKNAPIYRRLPPANFGCRPSV